MKSKLLEPVQASPSRDRMTTCAPSPASACKPGTTGTQRPFCMLCIYCPKCADNPHQVTCPLCAACRTCEMHSLAHTSMRDSLAGMQGQG